MKRRELKKLISEELQRFSFREATDEVEAQAQVKPTNSTPTLNPKKAHGILAGAIKTLINSGAAVGVDQTHVAQLTQDVIDNLSTVISSLKPVEVDASDDSTDLEDEGAYKKENDEFDDQSQYDPSLEKQLEKPEDEESAGDEAAPAEEAPPEDDMGGLFEVKDLKSIYNLK